MSKWDVWTLVVGEKLPMDWLTIPGLEIHPAEEEELTSLRSRRVDVPVEFNPGRPNHFDVSRAPVHVESKWILRFELEADDRDKAHERVSAEAATYSSLLDSLTPEATKPFHLEILAVGNQETGEVVAMPLTWNVYPVDVRPMSTEDRSILQSRASLFAPGGNKGPERAARAAVGLLRDATYLADTAMGLELLETASLLLYFQIIEGIVHFVAKSRSSADEEAIDVERERIVGDLTTAIESATSPGDVSRLIHTADYDLRQAEATHLRGRIEAAGQLIGVGQLLIEEAQTFLVVRNSSLAHFGASLPRGEWVHWFHQRNARRVATYFLAAFLDWLTL